MDIIDYLTYNETSKEARWANKHYDEVSFKSIKVKQDRYRGVVINAEIVTGPYRNRLEIIIDDDGVCNMDCDCPFYHYGDPCGHLIVLMMKLKELYPFKIPFSYRDLSFENTLEEDPRSRYEKMMEELRRQREENERRNRHNNTDLLISSVKNSMFKNVETSSLAMMDLEDGEIIISIEKYNPYHDYYYYQNDNDVYLKFKIARKNYRSYYIKNIPDFLGRVAGEEYYSYGKELAFKHSLNYFDDNSKKIIDFMRREFNSYKDNDNRYIMVKHIGEYYNLFDQMDDRYHPGFRYDTEDLNIYLDVIAENGYLRFKFPEEYRRSIVVRDNLLYTLDDACDLTIYKANDVTYAFLRNLIYELSFEVNLEDLGEFKRYVIRPTLKYITYEGYDFISDEKMADKIEVYADLDEDESLLVNAIYYIDNEKHYSFIDDHKPYECQIVEDCIRKYEPEIEGSIARIFDEDKISAFVRSGVPFLMDYAEILISDHLKNYNKPKSMNISIGVRVDNNLLNLDISGLNIKQEDIAGILSAYHKKKRFHRLKNGETIQLNPKELEVLDDTLSELGISDKQLNKGIKLPLYKSLTLDSLSKDSSLAVKANERYYDMIKKVETKTIDSYEVPDRYQKILKEYQVFGYRWMKMLRDYGFGGILADDMGLGKTIQVLSLLESIKYKDRHSIVVCPASLVYNWEDETKKFECGLKVLCITGKEAYRKELIQRINDYDLVITSYDYIRRDIDLYQDYVFEYVILDEAQYIKNQSTKNAQCVKELKSRYRLALSGTPIENSLAELWSIFDFLMSGYLNNYTHFKKTYETPIVKGEDNEKALKLKSYVEPFILRRRKRDVLKELPERIDKSIYIEFNDEEEKIYQANAVMASRELQEMLNVEGDNYNKIVVLSMLTKLRQLCIDSRLLYDNVHEISSKMKACIELVLRLKANHERVLIFSSFKSLLELLSIELSKNDISYHMLTGDTSKEERKELVDSFQNNDVDAFLISLKAGGTGLNLTAATAVIHFDPWWNLSAQNQASDRAHRIGQKHSVQVFSLIMKNSIEEKIEELQKRKKELSDMFTEGNEGSITSMNKDDLMYLFSTKG